MSTPDRDDLVWHYTTLETLELILRSQTLLATEASFQNDPNEASYARDLIAEGLERAENRHRGIGRQLKSIAANSESPYSVGLNLERLLSGSRFLLCASSDGDSMYCWRTYGAVGSIGCAIGLDPAVFLGVRGSGGEVPAAWQSVTYSKDKLEDLIDDRIDEIAKNYLATESIGHGPNLGELIVGYDDIQSLVFSLAKSPSYENEKESRITVTRPPAEALSFGAGPFGPRPRVALRTLTPQTGGPTENGEALPIQEIRLGPAAPRGAELSLRWVLATHGYSLDGLEEYEEYENERGEVIPNRRLNRDRAVRVSRSQHAYRDM
ncbi:DUF2971 domain-containing protein [Agreia sp. COWG]|uniref:DUF2971 domain-containing protein n=1 Tax=Agreia sp. COWG TaxID=2773266 RepID=UPI001928F7E0|nr:DUF2971 domain-containing protein [Agreia sp. COWG]